jgi:5-oxoprolinase (ATP-hydrolysing)
MVGTDKITFAIDRGGTFTDITATYGGGRVMTTKVLSQSPEYPDAPSEGIRVVLEAITGKPISRPVPIDRLEEVRMGTTVATNALLERKGARVLLVVTRGFHDVIEIGTQARPDLFDLNIRRPSAIAERTVEVTERMRLERDAKTDKLVASPIVPLDETTARRELQAAFDDGIRSVAISFVHSFANPDHEDKVVALAKDIGFTTISASSALVPVIKYLPRTMTAVVNAYLEPVVAEYIRSFKAQFAQACAGVPLLFMQSDGGLVPAESFNAFRAVLSGPAGGVTGCGRAGVQAFGPDTPLVGFDMGGTSTDVCRCVDGQVETTMETCVAGAIMQFPQVDVHTVAAGGGSVLEFREGMFVVGPHSAGAMPGPMCYGRGGPLTVTDANLLLGRVHPFMLPSVFGKDNKSPVDLAPVREAFDTLAKLVSEQTNVQYDAAKVARSFIDVANEQMCRPIRTLTEGRGYRCKDHVLVSFGGAGGQHAVDIARKLGMTRVLVHRHASVLSAVGIGTASIVRERLLSWGGQLTEENIIHMDRALDEVTAEERGQLNASMRDRAGVTKYFAMRFEGTSAALSISVTGTADCKALITRFNAQYRVEFGFTLSRPILVDNLRVRLAYGDCHVFIDEDSTVQEVNAAPSDERPACVRVMFSDGTTAEARIVDTTSGALDVSGPALLRCRGSTVVLDARCKASINSAGDIVIDLQGDESVSVGVGEQLTPSTTSHGGHETTSPDPRALTVFAHRFMSIAEQMGRALQQTAVSTNIKERLDFSCAIFDADAGLVANAPHIPVHLGAMGATVRFQIDKFGQDWHNDDVIVCNHPAHGGSHLPDITVISPVVLPQSGERIAYVASRAHHCDIGGLTPGSMPPFSASLLEEGAVIEGFKLVQGGEFDEQGISAILMKPAEVPGCAGCRQLPDVLSDLRAQVAANRKGIDLLLELMKRDGELQVAAYMRHLQDAAAAAVRDLIRRRARQENENAGSKGGKAVMRYVDQMDDGSPIALAVTLDGDAGTAKFDFTGTGRQVHSSVNCPPQVVRSAVLYSLRCLLNDLSATLPLNEGCMRHVTVVLPDPSLVSPSPDAAIVAGNVLTSQRITDVILAAFRACACSQGCMNNLTFGNDKYSYYETVCGGSGAGPDFDGTSAVHTHMTNTRITDVEWLESRFPVLLREFRIREGSGGLGRHRGGNGAVRSFVFLTPMTVCILSERRSVAPRGLLGGCDGAKGVNLVRRNHGESVAEVLAMRPDEVRAISVGGKNRIAVDELDVFTMFTPGAGGYGELN